MKLRLSLSLALTLLWAAPGHAQEEVTPKELKSWLSHLSSDEMKGRRTGSPEIEKAASWLADRFKSFGLQPPPGQKGYFQDFEFVSGFGGKTTRAKNVVGFLEGSDPKLKGEFILLTAHYDHIGTGRAIEGDNIYNGADDDASGVTMMLGIAAALHRRKAAPKRSLVFIAWSGEELGLKGSKHYAKNPLFPLEKTVCNFNFEMVGHTQGQGKNQIWITGASYSDFADILKAQGKDAHWKVTPCPYPRMGLFFRSDNASLAVLRSDRKSKTIYGIPAHSISTWGQEGHYHKPSDEADSIDYANLAKLVTFMTRSLLHLAGRKDWIRWKPEAKIRGGYVLKRYQK